MHNEQQLPRRLLIGHPECAQLRSPGSSELRWTSAAGQKATIAHLEASLSKQDQGGEPPPLPPPPPPPR